VITNFPFIKESLKKAFRSPPFLRTGTFLEIPYTRGVNFFQEEKNQTGQVILDGGNLAPQESAAKLFPKGEIQIL
jgi:hypothetical protein